MDRNEQIGLQAARNRGAFLQDKKRSSSRVSATRTRPCDQFIPDRARHAQRHILFARAVRGEMAPGSCRHARINHHQRPTGGP